VNGLFSGAKIDEAVPNLRKFAQEEAEIAGNPRLQRRQGREYLFGRVAPKAKEEDEEDDDDEEGKAQVRERSACLYLGAKKS